jgi:hypothetical protein
MAKNGKPTKSEQQARLAKPKAEPEIKALKEDQKPVPAPEGAKEDQKSAPAKGTKKVSGTVAKWRAQDAFQPGQKIHLLVQGNPKRRGAAERYAEYKEGMTVAQYQEAMKAKGSSPKLAMADMRWDYAAGFIDIK